MLPIKLKIKGINSFKTEQVLDFHELNSGFFGIFGATGSGKSSILDSLMLALYGKTPRAKIANDFISLNKNVAEVSFQFKDLDDEFLIERSFKRKSDGRQTESTACLYKLEGESFNVLSEGSISVDAKIKEILGMGFEEFSKVIALPQGQFANFLKATSSERTNLISNLFNLQEYGDSLTLVAKSKEKEKELELAEINGQLLACGEIKEEDIESICREIDDKNKTLDDYCEQIKILSEQLTNLEIVVMKYNELKKAEKTLEELESKEEIINERRDRVDKISSAILLAKKLEESKLLSNEIAKMQDNLSELRVKFDGACKEYDNLKTDVEDINANFEANYKELLQSKSKAEELIKQQEEIALNEPIISDIQNQHKHYSEKLAELSEDKIKLEKLKVNLESELDKNKEYLAEVCVDASISQQVKKGVELSSQIEIIDNVAGDLTSLKFDLVKRSNDNANKVKSSNEVVADDYANGYYDCYQFVNQQLEDEITKLFSLKSQRKNIVDSLEKRFGGQSIYYIKNAIEKSETTETNIKNKITELEKNIGDVAVQIKLLESSLTDCELNIGSMNVKIQDFEIKRGTFLNAKESLTDQELTDFIGEIANRIENIVSERQQKEKMLNVVYNQRIALEAEMKQTLVSLNTKQQTYQVLQKEIESELKTAGVSSEEALELSAQEAFLPKLKESIEQFDVQKNLNLNLKANLEAEIGKNQYEIEGIEDKQNHKNDLTEKISIINQEIGTLLGQKEQKASELKKKRLLEEKKQNNQKSLDLIKSLTKLLKGKALAEFISQIYLVNITERANTIAQTLLDGEFTLKYQKGEFFVLDNLNNQELRTVSTLSGGETFLISLSLSLAISEAISNQANKHIDFFFLDEGFGSLDNELCETVVSALYKLQNQNLKIGVISHVDLLKEKINNKILVTKDSNGVSSLRVDVSI